MFRPACPVFRAFAIVMVVAASGTATYGRPDDPAPPPRAVPNATAPLAAPRAAPAAGPTMPQPPAPAAMGWPNYFTPGGAFTAYPGVAAYPGYGYGFAQGMLPPRVVYGPSISPNEYPYTRFVAGYPYPGYTAVSPYPLTVSSYSSGPSAWPVVGRLGGRRW